MAKSRKKSREKSGGGLLFKIVVAAFIVLLLWAAGRFDIKGRTAYEHADAAMHVRFLQPLYDTLTGEASDVADKALEAMPDKIDMKALKEVVPSAVKTAPRQDGTPMDNITEEDRKALDDLIDKKSTRK